MSRKLSGLAALVLALCLLTGCSPLLERTYSTAEPHSSKFWESEAAGTLRAENHQDVVNDLLLLVGQHRETAALRLYDFKSELAVADVLEAAAAEVQQETPMGAYAVEFITTSSYAQRGYYEVAVRIGYRRTLEQLQAVVNATSPEALYSLLAAALDEGKTELAVRMGYWGENGRTRVEEAMAQLREERELTETVPWVVNYYPAEEKPGLVEFLLDPPEEDGLPGEEGEAFGGAGEAIGGENDGETADEGGEAAAKDGPEESPEKPAQDKPHSGEAAANPEEAPEETGAEPPPAAPAEDGGKN